VIDAARERIAAALMPGGIAVLSGAGMSAESGIPTFRDAVMSASSAPAALVPQGERDAPERPGGGAGL
jgi:hypothetical protein